MTTNNKKPHRFVVRKNKIIPLTKSLVNKIKSIRPDLFINTEESDLCDNKNIEDNDSTSSSGDLDRTLSSPNTINMSKIILDNQKLKEKQQKIEHDIDNRITELVNEINEYKDKIKNLEEKKSKYEKMKGNYGESSVSNFCIIL